MRIIACIFVFVLLWLIFLGVCQGATWLGYNYPKPNRNTHYLDQNGGLWLRLESEDKLHFVSSRLLMSETPEDIVLTITMIINRLDPNITTYLALDDQELEMVSHESFFKEYSSGDNMSQFVASFSVLNEGYHAIEIRATGKTLYNATFDCSGVAFFLIDNLTPTINDISIKNSTYTEKDLELIGTTSEPFSWIAYSLDGQVNVTIKKVTQQVSMLDHVTQAKTYLANLTEGTHTLTLYAEDTAGNLVASETIMFTVDCPKPFLDAAIIAVVLVATVIPCAIFLLTRRRRRRFVSTSKNILDGFP